MQAGGRTAARDRDLDEQRSELLAGEEAALVELERAAATATGETDECLRITIDEAGRGSATQARLEWQHGVADRPVAEPAAVLTRLPAQPIHEGAGALLVDVLESMLGREVGKRVRDQQPPVLAAGAVVDDVVGARSTHSSA